MDHLSPGKCFLLIVLALTSCGAASTAVVPPGAPTPSAVEERLLSQIAEEICPYPDDPGRIDPFERYFTSNDPFYSLVCYPATGHSLTVTIRRFAGPAHAMAEFESGGTRGLRQEVQGFPASDWEEDYPSFPGGRKEVRVRLMRAGSWLIRIEAFDDTRFQIAPDPRDVSQAVVRAVKEQGSPAGPEGSPP